MTNDELYDSLQKTFKEVAKEYNLNTMDEVLSYLNKTIGRGSKISSMQSVLTGFNKNQQGNAVLSNNDMMGYIFFTRPDLNLSYDNISLIRKLNLLGGQVANSYQRMVRALLDTTNASSDEYKTDLVDNNSPFIPWFSTTCINCNGWPDLKLNLFRTQEGIAKEVWAMVDDIVDINGYFELNVTFQNLQGSPHILALLTWIMYASYVYLGKLSPHKRNIIEDEMDYNTRIYRFTMDYTNRYIQNWAATGASFPIGLPMGAIFNYNRDNIFNEDMKTLSIPFACIGADYNDPITLLEFNDLQEEFHPALINNPNDFVRQRPDEMLKYNYKGYPRIDLETNELYWMIPKSQVIA